MSPSPPSELRRIIAANVRRRRDELGYSQERLAGEASLHRTYVGSVERGERNVSVDILAKLAVALDVPAWELLRPTRPAS